MGTDVTQPVYEAFQEGIVKELRTENEQLRALVNDCSVCRELDRAARIEAAVDAITKGAEHDDAR